MFFEKIVTRIHSIMTFIDDFYERCIHIRTVVIKSFFFLMRWYVMLTVFGSPFESIIVYSSLLEARFLQIKQTDR